ncbi:MAG TPA: hypothetical protein VM717_04420 [Chthoniobacterales bacterium]|nr:hypothetical protein [Chthoniobacterales bacterium]
MPVSPNKGTLTRHQSIKRVLDLRRQHLDGYDALPEVYKTWLRGVYKSS